MTNNENKLYGVTALYDTPDKIINASKKIKRAGYKKFDINTPYPIHGMDSAMGLKSSWLGYVTIIAGLSGAIFILLFMWWALSVNYPLIIGGKPFFALPAYIPITFETTVLFATVTTAIVMIIVLFNFPNHNHPLHDSEYMKNVSVDKYGVVVEAADPLFDQNKVLDFLKELGAIETELIYYPPKEEFTIFQPKFLFFLLIIAVITSGSTYITLNKLMYLPPFDFMSNQNKGVSQEPSNFFYDGREMRTPVIGTVARNYVPYPYEGKPDPAVAYSNPLLPTKNVLKLGKRKFLTYCSPCHGNLAEGNSRLQGQFPPGPSLHTARVIGFSDGKLYHIITNGQNAMPSYAYQITREQRWAIINYIRVLQRAQNPKPTDFTAIKEFNKESGKNVQN